MQPAAARALHQEHQTLDTTLDRLREIADSLDDAAPDAAVGLIREATGIVGQHIVEHERDDESRVYPRLAKFLRDGHGLAAMSRAHREILHLARLLERLSDGLKAEDADRYLIRDAQRVIESYSNPSSACTMRRKKTSTSTLQPVRQMLGHATSTPGQSVPLTGAR